MSKLDEYKAHLELESMGMQRGQQKRILCPRCDGGTSKEDSYLIRVDDDSTASGYCYRASCNLYIREGERPSFREQGKKMFNPRPYPNNELMCIIPSTVARKIKRKYTLKRYELKKNVMAYNPHKRELYMPVFDEFGRPYGGVSKLLYPRKGIDKVKTKTYFEKQNLGLTFPLNHGIMGVYKKIFLVEDILSAIRMNRYVKCAAMLGTNLNDEKVRHLSTLTKNLCLAFDNDAFEKSMGYAKKYADSFDSIKAYYLTHDPKDYPTDKALIKDLEL